MPARSSAPSRRSRAEPNGGLIVTASALRSRHRDLIIALAAQHNACPPCTPPLLRRRRRPDVLRPRSVDQYRRAAGYVDRILKGEKPADLPVQARPSTNCHQPQDREGPRPHLPPSLLARADEVIE